jgi:hypothetical protein
MISTKCQNPRHMTYAATQLWDVENNLVDTPEAA